MHDVILGLLVLSIVASIVGLIRPKLIGLDSRKNVGLGLGLVAAVLIALAGMTTPGNTALPGINSAGAIAPTPASNATANTNSPAYVLAMYDSKTHPDLATVTRYQAALDSLEPFCTEDEATLAGEVWSSWNDLQKNGVSDETNLSLIGHIKESIPQGAVPTDCRQVMAAYLVMREPLQ
jgi:hypothetical protein